MTIPRTHDICSGGKIGHNNDPVAEIDNLNQPPEIIHHLTPLQISTRTVGHPSWLWEGPSRQSTDEYYRNLVDYGLPLEPAALADF
jgi:hypothetical protein